jgi:aryl-alcohol dehydrogenase-like predicted oxidoreductase
MEQRTLGRSGLSVSVFGLGTMTFGAEADEAVSVDILDHYVAAGGSFIDTADVYSAGASEEIIGRWLARRGSRDEIVVATKGRFPMGPEPTDGGAGRRYLTQAIEASLVRLGVDYVDLYQVHAWDPTTDLDETLGVLDEFVVTGRARAVGVSNFCGWQLQRAVSRSSELGLTPLASLQPQYSLLGREIESEILPVCIEEGLGVLPWSPLAGGWLTGKYAATEPPAGDTRLGDDPTRGIEAYDLRNRPSTWRVLDVVASIAADRNVSMAQVALNWVRARPAVASVLVGARTVEQLNDNLSALAWSLSADEMERLTVVSAPGMPLYPHGFLEAYAGVTTWADLGYRSEPPPITR